MSTTVRRKRCPKCKQNLILGAFYKNRAKKDGLSCYCKVCRDRSVKKYRSENREKLRRRQAAYRKTERGRELCRRNQLKHAYGITPEQHKQMYVNQDGQCAICLYVVPYSKICVDHDHKTGKVRGLLCQRCNMLLTGFDDVEFRSRAMEYIN